MEALALWMFLGSSGWSVGVVRVLLFIWQAGPGSLNWLISSSYLMFWAFSWIKCLRLKSVDAADRSDPVKFYICLFQTGRSDAELPSELVGKFEKPGPWQVSIDWDNSCFTGSSNLFLWFRAIWFRLEKKMWKSKHPASLWKLCTFSFLILKRILKHVCKSCYYRYLSLIKYLKQTWNSQHNMISRNGI